MLILYDAVKMCIVWLMIMIKINMFIASFIFRRGVGFLIGCVSGMEWGWIGRVRNIDMLVISLLVSVKVRNSFDFC